MTITLGLLALAIIGLLIYVLASNPKVGEIGRLMFACALLAICLEIAPHIGVVRIGR